MPVLNIRIVELMTKERRSSINYLYTFVHTSDTQNKMVKLKITTNKKGNVLVCEKQISFKIEYQSDNYLYFDFKRHRMLISDDLLGRLVLPLDWFPTNYVVREWFPISKQGKGNEEAMILLDIHVDHRNVQPFMAPFSTMKVIPSWERPKLTENAEVAANPPVVYVISPQSNCIVIPPDRSRNNPYCPPHQEAYRQDQLPYYFMPQQTVSQPNIQLMQQNSNSQSSIQLMQQNSNSQPNIQLMTQTYQLNTDAQPPVSPYRIEQNVVNQSQQENIQVCSQQNCNQQIVSKQNQKSESSVPEQQQLNDVQKQLSQQKVTSDYQRKNFRSTSQQSTFNYPKPKDHQIIHQSLLNDQEAPIYYPSIPQYPNLSNE